MREQPLKHGSRTRIKICGLTRPEDIQAVNQAKPDFAGFIVEFPKSRRNVTVEQLKAFREELDDEYYVQEKTDSDEIYSKENNYGWEPVGEKFRIQIDEDLDIADKIIGGAGEPTYIDLK